MARPRKANRDKAFEMYKEMKVKITTKEIAEILQENISTVRGWRAKDEWDMKLFGVKNKRGGQRGNVNALKHGKYISGKMTLQRKRKLLENSIKNRVNYNKNQEGYRKVRLPIF